MRVYHINTSVSPPSRTLPPHLQHFYFYAHSKLHHLTAGSDHWQLERQQPPLPNFRPGNAAQSLPQPQEFLICYTKGRSQGKVTSHRALGAECEGHGLPEPPSKLVSHILRLLQRTQGWYWDQSSKGATKPSREKKLSSVYIRFS